MKKKYKVNVPTGGARHALPGEGLITIREDMAERHIEALIEAGVTSYFETEFVNPQTTDNNGQKPDGEAAEAGANSTNTPTAKRATRNA